MSIKVNRLALNDALKALRVVASTNAIVPVLQNVCLDPASTNTLILSANNLEVFGERKVPYTGTGPLPACTVNAKAFSDFVAAFSGDEVTLKLDGEKLRVSSGKQRASLPIIDRSEFPERPQLTEGANVTFPRDTFDRIVARTVPFASTGNDRPILTAVNVDSTAERLRFAAADNYRVGIVTLPSNGILFSVNIPAASLGLVSKIVQGEEITLILNDRLVTFVGYQSEMTSRVIEGQFPAIEGVLNGLGVQPILMSREELSAAMRLASIASVLVTKFATTDDGLKVTATDFDKEFETTVDATVGVEGAASFALNPKYVVSVLSALGDSSEVEVLYGSRLAPVTLRDPDDATFKAVIMPVRTPE